MKRYKPLILQIGILLFFISLVLFFLEQQKKFITTDLTKHYSKNKTIELSGFEEGERWQGNFSYDSQRVLEGKSSVTLSSWYGKENSIKSSQDTLLLPGYANGYVSLYIADSQKLSSLVSLSLVLTGEKDQTKEYVFTPEIHVGWNRIAVPMPSWGKITKKVFSITSKPESIAEVNLDRFWIENTSVYNSDVFLSQGEALSLRTIGERTYLFSASSTQEVYSLITPSTLSKGSLTISLIPEHAKEIRLSLNGTSMKIAGNSMNECLLYRNDDKPQTKILQTTSGKDNLYVFIKAEIQKGTVAYSLSNNGVDFESCGAVVASQKKQVQLSLQGSYLIDSYSAEY